MKLEVTAVAGYMWEVTVREPAEIEGMEIHFICRESDHEGARRKLRTLLGRDVEIDMSALEE